MEVLELLWVCSVLCQISVLRLATHTYQEEQDLEEKQVSEVVMWQVGMGVGVGGNGWGLRGYKGCQ